LWTLPGKKLCDTLTTRETVFSYNEVCRLRQQTITGFLDVHLIRQTDTHFRTVIYYQGSFKAQLL